LTDIEDRLAELRELGLYRRTRMVSGPQGPRVVLDGKPVLLLCSNNYLGLADHPRVREAAADAAMRWGVGAGASRLVSGTMTVHRRLEERLAGFEDRDAAPLFGSGYLANLGVVSALAGAGSVVLSDELNHASIVDGCRLARAETFVYRHADVEHLAWGLRNAEGRSALIVTDSVFSMDGDVAPLAEIVELARRHRVRVVVDEAHGIGCMGPGGRGAVHDAGVEDEVDVVIGTLGKALGTYGAYAACDHAMAQLLVNTARPFIFSTAPPPALASAIYTSLTLIEQEPERRERVRELAAVLRAHLTEAGVPIGPGTSHIVPVLIGDNDAAVALAGMLQREGFDVRAIRPPTVPPGTARLRVSVNANLTPELMEQFAVSLTTALSRVGVRA
jgi:glycine C-acetyltransferase/8-amino-7-oxononanoate synthase